MINNLFLDKINRWHWLNFRRAIWDLPVEADVSHAASSHQVPTCEMSNVNASPAGKILEKKTRSSALGASPGTVSHQHWAAERANAIPSNTGWRKGHQGPTCPASVTGSRSSGSEGMRNGEFLKRKERRTPLWQPGNVGDPPSCV